MQAPQTGGEDGIQAVPRGNLFGALSLADDRTLYYVVAVIFFAGLLLIYRIIHSPFGQVLKAIRDNEPRATSLGYRTNQYKLMVFVLSTTLGQLHIKYFGSGLMKDNLSPGFLVRMLNKVF